MLYFIDKVLASFRSVFSRNAAYKWFVIAVIGLMLRSDHLGVTSIMRDLGLAPICYESLIHFFHSEAWNVQEVAWQWLKVVNTYAPLYHTCHGMCVMAGDGTKQSKEGRYMPGVKRLAQESEDSSKPEYIFGHMFGGLGILAGCLDKLYCIPLRFNIQDGLQATIDWKGSQVSSESHVCQMILNAFHATEIFGTTLLLLDRYFMTVPALQLLKQLNGETIRLYIVTRAKLNCTAYEKVWEQPARGRPRKKGQSVKLFDLFESCAEQFVATKANIYGKTEDIQYLCRNYLWGKGLYQELRFVLVKSGSKKCIFVSTFTSLDPMSMIQLYSQRFKIECCFREFKQCLGGFCYRFWTKSTPKLNRFSKKEDKDPLKTVVDPNARRKIVGSVKATEGFVQLAVVAMGLIQILSLTFSCSISANRLRYMRTPSKQILSEATFMDFWRKNIFRFMAEHPDLPIVHIIREKQMKPDSDEMPNVS